MFKTIYKFYIPKQNKETISSIAPILQQYAKTDYGLLILMAGLILAYLSNMIHLIDLNTLYLGFAFMLLIILKNVAIRTATKELKKVTGKEHGIRFSKNIFTAEKYIILTYILLILIQWIIQITQ